MTGLDMGDTQVYQTTIACLSRGRLLVDAKTVLTGILTAPLSRPKLIHQLTQAGLELWQAPEGFWAVRLKQVVAPVLPFRPRRRRRSQ
jgi:hypothetical protein